MNGLGGGKGDIFYTENLTRLPRARKVVAAVVVMVVVVVAYRTGTEKPASNLLAPLPANGHRKGIPL